MIAVFVALAKIGFIYIVIGLMWAGAEKLFYGKRSPRLIDDVVAIVLATALYALFWA